MGNVVLAAAGVTMIIFACLSAYAWTTKTDFTGFGPYLFAALCGLTIFGFVVALAESVYGTQFKTMSLVYGLCSILLFMFYIIYDTQMMLGPGVDTRSSSTSTTMSLRRSPCTWTSSTSSFNSCSSSVTITKKETEGESLRGRESQRELRAA